MKDVFKTILNNSRKVLNYTQAYFSCKKKLSQMARYTIKEIDSFYKEINQSDFINSIGKKSNNSTGFFHLNMLSRFRAPAIYVICRIFKPEIVVETGVADGFSSSFILKALELNNKGKLFSIDLPNQPGQEINNEPGWLVPNELRHRWKFILGNSKDKLPVLLKELKRIDLFYHDSDHSYENMMFEFREAWDYISLGGILISDDITENIAFDEFVKMKESKYLKLFKLGLLRKENLF